MERWNRYWFARSSGRALALLRIAVAASLLLTLWRLVGGPGGGDVDLDARARLYHPVGVLRLAGGAPPPGLALGVIAAIAWTAALAMLVGFRTRVATVLAALTTIALASYAESYTPTWSHSLNAPLLAAIALFGARTGEALSVDAWLRARRGDTSPPPPLTIAPARMVQLAVGLMFVSAATIKIVSGGGSLDWALSDNLRHQILARFDMLATPRTRAADWLLAASWRWQLGALFNLACQLAPLVAIVLASRPRVRAVCAALFVVEVLGLGVVMDLWNPQWLPLAAAFLDWDWLLARRSGVDAAPAPARPRAAWYTAAFVALDVIASFAPGALSQGLGLYPFTNFPMFSNIRARRPYDRHQPYTTLGQEIEVLGDRPLARAEQDVIDADIVYRRFYRLRDPAALRDALTVVVADARVRFPDVKVRGARLWVAEIAVPAYPAAARIDVRRVAVLGELDGADFRSELAHPAAAVAAPAAQRVDVAGEPVKVTSVADVDGVTRPFIARD